MGIFDFASDLGPKLGQTQPNISGTVPTNRHTKIPNDSGPISACVDDDPTILNCEIAHPKWGPKGPKSSMFKSRAENRAYLKIQSDPCLPKTHAKGWGGQPPHRFRGLWAGTTDVCA